MTSVLTKWGNLDPHTKREGNVKAHKDYLKVKDWSDVSINKGMPGATRIYMRNMEQILS